MNCYCNKPAVVRTVSKPGLNIGRQFFSCSNNGDCNFFCWVGASQPINVRQKIQNPQSLQPQANKKSCTVRLALHEFEETPSRRIWFSSMNCYDAMLMKFFMSIPEYRRKYVDNIKLWVFDFDIYEFFVSNLKSDDFDFVNLVELPRFLSTGLRKYLNSLLLEPNMNENISLNLEPTITECLLPFQIDGVKFVIRHGGKAMIADEMGCGKTIQAIALMQHYRNQWPVLILVPPQLLKQWYDELRKFAGDLLLEKDVCVIRKSSDNPRGKICIIPYSLLDKLVEQDKISPQRFGMVVCDESHNIKNKTAKRTSMAIPFMRAAGVCLCLSGTPATNRPEELFTQLSGIRPEIFGDSDYRDFTIRYCDAKDGRFGWETKGSSNEVELKLLLEGCIMIRRKKADVIFNLPTKDRIVRYVTADPQHLEEIKIKQTQARELDTAIRDAAGGDISVLKGLRQQQQVLLNAQWMITGMSKIEGVLSELRALIDEARTERVISEQLDDAKKAEAAAAAALEGDEAVLIDLLHEEEYDSDSSRKRSKGDNDMGWGRGLKNTGNGIGNILELGSNCINLLEGNMDGDVGEFPPIPLPDRSSASNGGSSSTNSPCNAKESAVSEFSTASGSSTTASGIEVTVNEVVAAAGKKQEDDDYLTDSDIDDAVNPGSSSKVNRRLVRLSHLSSHSKRKHKDDDDELADSDDGGGGDGAKSDHCKVNKRLVRLSFQSPDKSPAKKMKCVDSDELELRLFEDVDYASTVPNSSSKTTTNDNIVVIDDDEGVTEDIFFLDQPAGISRYGLRSQSKSKEKNHSKHNLFDRASTTSSNSYYSKESLMQTSAESSDHFDEIEAVDIWRKLLPGDRPIDALPPNTRSKQTKKKSSKHSTSRATLPSPISYRGLGRKIIVFAHHASVFDALEACLRQLEVPFIRIDGKVAAASRGELIRRFQEDDETDVALLSLTACGTGLNLTRANVAVFAELTWSPGLVEQAEARIHRIGQSSTSIKVIYILAKGTADDIVWEQLQKKHMVLGATLGITRDAQQQPQQYSLKTSLSSTISAPPPPPLNDQKLMLTSPVKVNDKDKNKDTAGSSYNRNTLTLDNYFSTIASTPPLSPPSLPVPPPVSGRMSDQTTGATAVTESKGSVLDGFLKEPSFPPPPPPAAAVDGCVTSNGIAVDNHQVNGPSIRNTAAAAATTSKVMPVCQALPSWVPRSRPFPPDTAPLSTTSATTTTSSESDGRGHHHSIASFTAPDSTPRNTSRPAHEYHTAASTSSSYTSAIPTVTSAASYSTAPTTIYSSAPTTSYSSAPTTSYFSAPTASYSSAPTTSYSSAPTTSYSSAPITSYSSAPITGYSSAPTTSYSSAPTTSYSAAPITSYSSAPNSSYSSAPITSYSSAPTTSYSSVPTTSYSSAPITSYSSAPITSYSSAPTTSYFSAPTTGYSSAPTTSYSSAPATSYPSAPITSYSSAPTASYSSAPITSYSSAPTTSFSSVPTTSYSSAPNSSYSSAPTTSYSSAPTTSYSSAPTTGYSSAPTTSYSSAPTTSYSSAPATSYPSAPNSSYFSAPTTSYSSAPTTSYSSVPTTSYSSAPITSYSSAPTTSYSSAPTTGYSSAPTTSYSSAPATSYSSTPTTSYSSAPTASYFSASTASYSSAPTTSYSSAPTTSYSSAPTTCYSSAPTTIYSSAPTASYSSAPTTSYSSAPTTSYSSAPITSYSSAPITSYSSGYSTHLQPPLLSLSLPQPGVGGNHRSHSTMDFEYSPASTGSASFPSPYPEPNNTGTQPVAQYDHIPSKLSSYDTVTSNASTAAVASISSPVRVSHGKSALAAAAAAAVSIMPGNASCPDASGEAAIRRRIEENKRRAQEILQRKKAEKGARDVMSLMDSIQSDKSQPTSHYKPAESNGRIPQQQQQSPLTTPSMQPNGSSYPQFPRQSSISRTEGSVTMFPAPLIPSGSAADGLPSHTTSTAFPHLGAPNSTTCNVPPTGSSSGSGHVFSTGRGSKLSVTSEAISRAEGLLSESFPARHSHTSSIASSAGERRPFTGAANHHPVLQSPPQTTTASASASALKQSTYYEHATLSAPLHLPPSPQIGQPTNTTLGVNPNINPNMSSKDSVPVFDNKSSYSYVGSSLKPLVRSVD